MVLGVMLGRNGASVLGHTEPNEESKSLMLGGETSEFREWPLRGAACARDGLEKLSKKGLERLRHFLLIPSGT